MTRKTLAVFCILIIIATIAIISAFFKTSSPVMPETLPEIIKYFDHRLEQAVGYITNIMGFYICFSSALLSVVIGQSKTRN